MGTDLIDQPHASQPAGECAAHCRRVAAIARLIAHHLFLPSEEKDLLRAACVLHHHDIGLLAPNVIDRLLADGFGEDAAALVVDERFAVMVLGLLKACDIHVSGTALESRLASVLRLADAFDWGMAEQSVNGADVDDILERLRDGVPTGRWPEELTNALVQSTRPLALGPTESWRLPVFPQAALRTLSLMRDPRANLTTVVEAASLDPVTAGFVMRLANSALFGTRKPIATLSNAIGRLGFATSQKVIMSAAMRPVFNSPGLQTAWQHSLEVADLSEQLAARAGAIDPAEAYLAGLLHDVGCIALLSMPLYDSARLQGLVHGSCPQVYAENLLLRTDHTVLGAQIAAGWRLPETIVAAIRQHHRPESPLACLLYVAEYLSGSEEDLPSTIRLKAALNGIGLARDEVCDCRVSTLGSWLAAA